MISAEMTEGADQMTDSAAVTTGVMTSGAVMVDVMCVAVMAVVIVQSEAGHHHGGMTATGIAAPEAS